MEPLSIISIALQLATNAPMLEKIITKERVHHYTRTETIELYRTTMVPLDSKKVN
ncbi:hypothetical protein OAD33_00270 [Alphaproteobacteria bacterium]|nr:hypothetical protein [Alphaproteobacteria bacterium]